MSTTQHLESCTFASAIKAIGRAFDQRCNREGTKYAGDLSLHHEIEGYFRGTVQERWVGYIGSVHDVDLTISHTGTQMIVVLKGYLRSSTAGDLGPREIRAIITFRRGYFYEPLEVMTIEDLAGREALQDFHERFTQRRQKELVKCAREMAKPMRGGGFSPR